MGRRGICIGTRRVSRIEKQPAHLGLLSHVQAAFSTDFTVPRYSDFGCSNSWLCAMSAAAVNSTSVDEFNAVSQESCTTPMI